MNRGTRKMSENLDQLTEKEIDMILYIIGDKKTILSYCLESGRLAKNEEKMRKIRTIMERESDKTSQGMNNQIHSGSYIQKHSIRNKQFLSLVLKQFLKVMEPEEKLMKVILIWIWLLIVSLLFYSVSSVCLCYLA